MWIVAGLLAAACSLAAQAQPAAAASPTADQVKAAYLHKFAGYVDWPPRVFSDAGAPFVVGVVGADQVYSELVRLVAGRTVQGRRVEVRALARDSAPLADGAVHVVFIGRDVGTPAAAAIVAAYKGRPILTVSDLPRGNDAGAALNFIESDKRVRFDAAPAVAEQGGLRLSSRLLAVAEHVTGANP